MFILLPHVCEPQSNLCIDFTASPAKRVVWPSLYDANWRDIAFQLVMSRNSFTTMAKMGCNRFRNFGAAIKRRKEGKEGEVCLDYLQPGPKKGGRAPGQPATCRTISDGRKWEPRRFLMLFKLSSIISQLWEKTLHFVRTTSVFRFFRVVISLLWFCSAK